MADRKQLVAAAEDLNKVVIAPEEAIDVKLSVAKIEAALRDAAKIVQPDDKLRAETLAVLAELTGQDFGAPTEAEQEAIAETLAEEEEEEQPAAKNAGPAEPKKARGRPQPPLGKFEPVRRGGSAYAKLLEAALASPTPLADAAKVAGTDRDKAVSALKRARIVNGIDYSLDDAGVLTVVLPKGVDAESVWQKAREKPTKAATNGATRVPARGLGEFKPVRANTKYHKMLEMAEKGDVISKIAKAIGVDEKEARWRFRYPLRQDHGIDSTVSEDGVVALVLPKGKSLADCVR